MKTFSDLKTAVQKANSPEQAAGTFIDAVSSLIENNSSDPGNINRIATDLRGNRQSLVHSLTGTGKSGSTV